jgi:hypothetical protein
MPWPPWLFFNSQVPIRVATREHVIWHRKRVWNMHCHSQPLPSTLHHNWNFHITVPACQQLFHDLVQVPPQRAATYSASLHSNQLYSSTDARERNALQALPRITIMFASLGGDNLRKLNMPINFHAAERGCWGEWKAERRRNTNTLS